MHELDEEDDEAFLPPGFLMPTSKPSSSSLALEAFLEDDATEDLVHQHADGKADNYEILPLLEDACMSIDFSTVEADISLHDIATPNKKKIVDDDAALDEKLDALAVALREEVQAGTLMMNNMESSANTVAIENSEGTMVDASMFPLVRCNERVASNGAAQDESTKEVESSQQLIRRLQRQLALALEEAKNLKAALVERDSAHQYAIKEVIQVKDQEIDCLQYQMDVLRRQTESHALNFAEAELIKTGECMDLQNDANSRENNFQNQSSPDALAVENIAQENHRDVELLRDRIKSMEMELNENMRDLTLAKSLIHSQHDEYLHQQTSFELEKNSLARKIDSLRNHISRLKAQTIAQAAALEGLKRVKNHALSSLQSQTDKLDKRVELQTMELISKDHEIVNLNVIILSLQADVHREKERHVVSDENETFHRTENEWEMLQRAIILLKADLFKCRNALAEREVQELDNMVMVESYARELTSLKLESENFARVAWSAMDETNHLIREKISTMQCIIDRKCVEVEVESALKEIRENEAKEVQDWMEMTFCKLEQDLHAAKEREQDIEERFASVVDAADNQIKVAIKTHDEAMKQLKEQRRL